MKKYGWIIVLMAILFALGTAAAETAPPPEGGTLPEFALPVPENTEHRMYLGIRNGDAVFRIPEIAAEIVIVEIFSMY